MEPGEADARDKLDKANAEIEADFQRWNINKNRDLRNCIEEMASRNINFYDSQLSCLESLLKKLKERKFQSSPLLNQRRDV
ncbi:hypothetical protein EB796_008332 [Bugula neritina]|uniref:Uncharacterized protein n=1 Tax=Bugula neritina TaxID=10212 RepID=A0A7J7K6X4_BUGNE|nr:hypothetical protein EB796_008332 [Bugula neritina]